MEPSGFSQNQLREINEGRAAGLDVSVYAKEEYTAMHMEQIRLGMMDGLPVEKYADPAFDWFQMQEIRIGMKEGIEYKRYAKPEIPYAKMREMRKGLIVGIDFTPYLYLDAGILRQMRKAVLSNVSIERYIHEGYNEEQLEQIRQAYEKNLDIDPYLTTELRGVAIQEICKGLEAGLDVSTYANPQFGWQQMRELRLGLENRVDITLYNNPFFSWQQMQEIRLGLEAGMDVSRYARLMYTAEDMKRLRLEQEQEIHADFEEDAGEEEENAPYLPVGTPVPDDDEESGAEEEQGADAIHFAYGANEMKAYIVYSRRLRRCTRKEIFEALQNEGITSGILEDGINSVLTDTIRERASVLIAEGKPPQKGKDGWYEYFFRTEINRAPKELADGSLDYQNVEWYEMVKKDQKVAYYHDAEPGIPGYTVKGKVLPGTKGREKRRLSGTGYRLMPDGKTYVSQLKGRIELQGNKLLITKVFVFDEVTMATGNVNVDGCVHVKGNVGSNAVVRATGDIVVDGFVECARLECKENIYLRQGVNATVTGGLIKAEGNVVGRFFEMISVHAKGDIRANSCMECDLYTEGQLIISGGSLIGGKAYAAQGLAAQNVGNRMGVPTYIRLGAGGDTSEKWEEIDRRAKTVEKEIAMYQETYNDMKGKYPPEEWNTVPIMLKLDDAIYEKEEELKGLRDEIDAIREAQSHIEAAAIVSGRLYERVTIEIDDMRWESKFMTNVKIRNTDAGIVVC